MLLYKIEKGNKFEIVPLSILSSDPSTFWINQLEEDEFSPNIAELMKFENMEFRNEQKSLSRIISKDGWLSSFPLQLNLNPSESQSQLRLRVFHKFVEDKIPSYEIDLFNFFHNMNLILNPEDPLKVLKIFNLNLLSQEDQTNANSLTSEFLVSNSYQNQIKIRNFYQDQDLGKLERTTIRFSNDLVEVLFCGKKEGCWR
jgi:hypothetical protein